MKKILFFIASLIVFINVAHADTGYSDWVEELDPNIEYEDIIEEKRYRFYKEKEIGEFVSVNKVTSHIYRYEDTSNYIISDYGNWMNKCDPKYKYEEKEYALVTPYQKIEDTSYIHLFELDDDIGFNDIKVYSNNEEVGYELLPCDFCSTDYHFIDKREKLLLKLDRKVDTKSLSFYLEANEKYPNIVYRLAGSIDIQASFKTFNKVPNSNTKNIFLDILAFNDATMSNILYTNEEIEVDEHTILYDTKVMCRAKERLTYRYDYIKDYYDDNYHVNVVGYQKDEDDYKIYYKYLIKEIIPDEIEEDNNIGVPDSSINVPEIDNNTSNDFTVNDNTNIGIENPNDEKNDNKKVSNINSEISKDNNDINIDSGNYNDIIEINSTNNSSEDEIDNELNKENMVIIDNKEGVSDKKHLVNTMKIDNTNNIIKYIILLVIIVTIIYIYYQNKKYVGKRK